MPQTAVQIVAMNELRTPGPWEAKGYGVYKGRDCFIVADTDVFHDEVNEANAAFIARACNAHDELVAALKLAEAAIDDCHQYRSHNHHQTLGILRDLIVKAEGRS